MPLLGAVVADSFLGRYRSIILAYTLYVLERASRSSLFNWWFFSMSVGIYIAVIVVSYVQENVGWGIAFGSLCAIMLCTFTFFLVGTPTYRLYKPTPSAEIPFARFARSLATLARSSGFMKRHRQREEEDEEATGKSEKAREVLRLVPIWAACLAYGMVYAQLMTLFNKQGRTMDRRVFDGLELPPAALQTIGAASVLTFVPIYDHLLVPALRYATGNPSGLTLLQRVGTGMAISLAAVSFAALVEARRLEVAWKHGLVDDPGVTVPMSCAWLVPQYAMMGVADVFALVGMQEFFYDQMPGELRSLGLALYLSVTGIGALISSALISFVDRVTSRGSGDSWFTDNLNRAHLDYFYWLLAGISAADLVLYLWLARSYVYNNRKTTI
ncbi:protein NRT1/ PTR FAMILY 5.14-like isoform X1 [Lolium rigidum]|uniref:protein NRT1/ PTR FAMILY 5.14-like isoform X1 n=1 Tax=Lolium rigidum TaxID=89674 RepID=UPI001F5D197D|nr:protein NRT1/ PTR FAMILY 5.14-like isoform X1 [Lolium rigidum]